MTQNEITLLDRYAEDLEYSAMESLKNCVYDLNLRGLFKRSGHLESIVYNDEKVHEEITYHISIAVEDYLEYTEDVADEYDLDEFKEIEDLMCENIRKEWL